jgi:hypothetical protein
MAASPNIKEGSKLVSQDLDPSLLLMIPTDPHNLIATIILGFAERILSLEL